MNITHTAAAQYTLDAPQQQWTDGGGGDARSLQVARFAGHELTAVVDPGHGYRLLYCSMATGGFATMEEAKAAAPEFAQLVLARLAEMIQPQREVFDGPFDTRQYDLSKSKLEGAGGIIGECSVLALQAASIARCVATNSTSTAIDILNSMRSDMTALERRLLTRRV